MSPVRKRPAKTAPTPPERDVTERQAPGYKRADFLRDLRKASSNRAKPLPPRPRPARSSGRG
jgi:hypothetical protein